LLNFSSRALPGPLWGSNAAIKLSVNRPWL
jgi:hypothetical protein